MTSKRLFFVPGPRYAEIDGRAACPVALYDNPGHNPVNIVVNIDFKVGMAGSEGGYDDVLTRTCRIMAEDREPNGDETCLREFYLWDDAEQAWWYHWQAKDGTWFDNLENYTTEELT